MPLPWQQWMPHYIDKWQGSADVQSLSDLGYRAVHNLMLEIWQSKDCALAIDDDSLAKQSRTFKRWAKCREEVLKYFDRTPEGRLTHEVLLHEWVKAEKKFSANKEARSKAGRRGNQARWADQKSGAEVLENQQTGIANAMGLRSDFIANASQNIATGTLTGTVTSTEEQKQGSTADAVPPSPPFLGVPLLGGNVHTVTDADVVLYEGSYPGVDVRRELRKILPWLDAHPEKRSKTVSGSKQRIVKWLNRTQDAGGSRGTHQGISGSGAKSPAAERRMQSVEASRAAFARRAGLAAVVDAGSGAVSQPGVSGLDAGYVSPGVGAHGAGPRTGGVYPGVVEDDFGVEVLPRPAGVGAAVGIPRGVATFGGGGT